LISTLHYAIEDRMQLFEYVAGLSSITHLWKFS